MQQKRATGKNHFKAFYIVVFLFFTSCTKAVEEVSDEVRISIYNGDFAKVIISNAAGSYAASGVIDHSEKDGKIWSFHLEKGSFSYTATDYRHEVRGSFEKKATLLTLSIDMQ